MPATRTPKAATALRSQSPYHSQHETQTQTQTTSEKLFYCSNCPRAFPTNRHLERHMDTHRLKHEIRHTKCPFENCDSVVKTHQRTNLYGHIRHHMGETLVCPMCPGSFECWESACMTRHWNEVHPEITTRPRWGKPIGMPAWGPSFLLPASSVKPRGTAAPPAIVMREKAYPFIPWTTGNLKTSRKAGNRDLDIPTTASSSLPIDVDEMDVEGEIDATAVLAAMLSAPAPQMVEQATPTSETDLTNEFFTLPGAEFPTTTTNPFPDFDLFTMATFEETLPEFPGFEQSVIFPNPAPSPSSSPTTTQDDLFNIFLPVEPVDFVANNNKSFEDLLTADMLAMLSPSNSTSSLDELFSQSSSSCGGGSGRASPL